MGRHLADMNWVDAETFLKDIKLALVPTGSIEQHGPHLPLGTDMRIAEHLAKLSALELNCVVTPVVPVGHAEYHSDFSGTLFVSQLVLKEYMKSICLSLAKYGITHILFINGHGGNLASLMDVSAEIRREEGVIAGAIQWWDLVGKIDSGVALFKHLGHGDIVETAMMLAIDSNIVNIDRANIPVTKQLTEKAFPCDRKVVRFEEGFFYMNLRTSDLTETGDFLELRNPLSQYQIIPPQDATVEDGEKFINAVVDYIRRVANEFTKIRLAPIKEYQFL